ncbi:hypothetical protein XELAEV_180047032mg, partial [Xenopus laevis]
MLSACPFSACLLSILLSQPALAAQRRKGLFHQRL